MSIILQFHLVAQIALAALLSMIIGLDRERRDKSAGLRTHMLTGLGACLFTAIGAHAIPVGDPTRIAAGVVSGIGFLGAGVIFRSQDRVRDLTTAASIWATAAVGATVALDAWFLAIGATLLIWFILAILHRWEIRDLVRDKNTPNFAKSDEFPAIGQ
jgi:putative Mg2+ transporter-C (MgtC) family protein